MRLQIAIEPSGRIFSADPDETILAAAIRQGVGLPYGCKDGACGSCKCKKLEGSVAHGPHQHGGIAHLYVHTWEIDHNRDWDRLKAALQEAADSGLTPLDNAQAFEP